MFKNMAPNLTEINIFYSLEIVDGAMYSCKRVEI